MGTQDDDWGDDLDDYGAEEWEALLGGPDDVDIDNYLQSIGADDPSEFQECDDANAISTQTEAAREHSLSCPEQDLQEWVGSAFQPPFLHLLPFRLLPFGKRTVGVAVIRKATLVLVDPKGQSQIDDDKLRVFVVRSGQLAIIYRRTRMRTCTEKQALMAAALYRTFLNPSRRGLYKQPAKAKGLPRAKKPTPTRSLPKAISSIRFHEHEYLGTVIYWPKESEGKRIKVYFADELEKPRSDRLRNVRLSTFDQSFHKSDTQPAIGSTSGWVSAVSAYVDDLLRHIESYDIEALAESEFIRSLKDIFDGDLSTLSLDEVLRFLADLSNAEMGSGGADGLHSDYKGKVSRVTYQEKLWNMYRAKQAIKMDIGMEANVESTLSSDAPRRGIQEEARRRTPEQMNGEVYSRPSFEDLCAHYSAMQATRFVFMEHLLSFNSKPTDDTIHFRDNLGTLWVLTNCHDDESIVELTRYRYNDRGSSQETAVGLKDCADLVYDCVWSQKRTSGELDADLNTGNTSKEDYPYKAGGRVDYLKLTPAQLARYEAHKAKYGDAPTKDTAHLTPLVAAPEAKPATPTEKVGAGETVKVEGTVANPIVGDTRR